MIESLEIPGQFTEEQITKFTQLKNHSDANAPSFNSLYAPLWVPHKVWLTTLIHEVLLSIIWLQKINPPNWNNINCFDLSDLEKQRNFKSWIMWKLFLSLRRSLG